jgi:hypothetical protein
MKTAFIISTIIYGILFLIYVISSFHLIILLKRFIKLSSSKNKQLAIYTLLYLIFCLIGAIPNMALHPLISKMLYFFYMAGEILYLNTIQMLVIKNKRISRLFQFLLFCSIPLIIYTCIGLGQNLYSGFFFAYESIIFITISFVYFQEITQDISERNLFSFPEKT